MGTRLQAVVDWLEARQHRSRKGHDPVWYDLGAGDRQCLNCLKGGHRSRIQRPLLRPLQLAPRPVGL